jgi:periplasmic protein TonB
MRLKSRRGKVRMTLPGAPRSQATPRSESHDLDALLGRAFEEKPIWTGLYENLRDALFPPRLPPLELTSAPIAVPDRMAAKTNPWAVGAATLVNGGLVALMLLLGLQAASHNRTRPNGGPAIDLSDLIAPLTAQMAHGGGGGAHELIAPSEGRLPRFEITPLAPPQIPVVEDPKLAVEPAIAVQQIHLPEAASMPNIGVPNSPNVTLDSNGPGGEAGMGTGRNGGVGPGIGNGAGPGPSGGVYTPGGDVSAPVPLVTPEAEFSDEARRAKYQGVCEIAIIVDAQGNPQNPRVVRSLGMGLDEKALEAVMRYRFKPARRQGRAVPVLITVAVNFRLY